MAKLSLTRLAGGYLSTAAVNANYTLMETALDNTLSRDGSTPNTMSADIDMNSSGRITNMLDAVNNQEPITLAQAALIAGVTSPLTQDTVAAVLWPQSAIETANSSTATELQYYYGDVQRYGAKLDGATDDTTAFNTATSSGYEAYCDSGTAAISGTITIAAAQTLRCTSWVTLQRFAGAATTPIIHQYGNLSRFLGGGCVIRQNLYDHPKGIVLFGQDPDEATPGAGTDVQCYNMIFEDAKIVGPEGSGPNAPILTESPGFYCHSLKRKSGYSNPTYKCTIRDVQILNCDINMEWSTDFNSNSLIGCYFHQWTTAALVTNASYGNRCTNYMFESALAVSTTRRYMIHLGELNSSTIETGSDATYSIKGALDNYFQGYQELRADGNFLMSVFTYTTPGGAAAGTFGHNTFDCIGNISGGAGVGGSSDATGLGTNTFLHPDLRKYRGGVAAFGDQVFRSLDDGSGTYSGGGSYAAFEGREVAIAEGTASSAFSVDGIGPNMSAMLIKVSYAAKADAISTGQVGEVHFAVQQETTASFLVRKIFESNTSFDEAQIVTPSVTMAAGDLSTEGKATFIFTTASPAGTNLFHISWHAQVISTESNANADFDDNIKIL